MITSVHMASCSGNRHLLNNSWRMIVNFESVLHLNWFNLARQNKYSHGMKRNSFSIGVDWNLSSGNLSVDFLLQIAGGCWPKMGAIFVANSKVSVAISLQLSSFFNNLGQSCTCPFCTPLATSSSAWPQFQTHCLKCNYLSSTSVSSYCTVMSFKMLSICAGIKIDI